MIVLFHQLILCVLDAIFFERISKLIMTIEEKIRDEKLQFGINREAAKVPALS